MACAVTCLRIEKLPGEFLVDHILRACMRACVRAFVRAWIEDACLPRKLDATEPTSEQPGEQNQSSSGSSLIDLP